LGRTKPFADGQKNVADMAFKPFPVDNWEAEGVEILSGIENT
jgi:hypothetical protein